MNNEDFIKEFKELLEKYKVEFQVNQEQVEGNLAETDIALLRKKESGNLFLEFDSELRKKLYE